MFLTPINLAAALALTPYFAAAFFPEQTIAAFRRIPSIARLIVPASLCIPYVLVAVPAHIFHWLWFALYAVLPVAISALLARACVADPEQRGNWRDFLVLAVIGFAVDLRWFQPAWPVRFAVFNKVLLLDAGIYALFIIRGITGAGFNLRFRVRDLGIGLREFAFYAPIAIPLGLALGFLHIHPAWHGTFHAIEAYVFSFFFIAVPEELFFRGWLQNLLERRIGRVWALLLTAALFGLSHWNKRALHFNWRYVLLAAIAGIFYGRAWRSERRVGASALTHATVDTLWGLFFQ
ncbi:MAG TPA: CPBP family intramembrane glutamic endopeptidase [Acidobacteriaceae bacterium]|nr:CPBP family intramembrane glutamic endopeptidase [Acidobacteriaceae bacterium]